MGEMRDRILLLGLLLFNIGLLVSALPQSDPSPLQGVELEGAPPILPGQSIGDYLSNILDGEGEARNDARHKRDFSSGEHNATAKWTDGDTELSITMIDGTCASGIKPHYIAGICLDDQNPPQDIECTVGDLISKFWSIRKDNPNLDVRRDKYMDLWDKYAANARDKWYRVLYSGVICDNQHDELRKLLALPPKVKHYAVTLLGSVVSGTIITSFRTAMLQLLGDPVPLDEYLNAAIGTILVMFTVTELASWQGRVPGAEIFVSVLFFTLAAEIAGRYLVQGAPTNGTAAGQASPCITPEQAADASLQLGMKSPDQLPVSSRTFYDLASTAEIAQMVQEQQGNCRGS